MVTRKCGNIYFRKYFFAARKFTNIFVLLLILMVGSRDTDRPTMAAPKCQPSEDEPPDHETGKKIIFYKWNTWRPVWIAKRYTAQFINA